jgi:hypothetical protein
VDELEYLTNEYNLEGLLVQRQHIEHEQEMNIAALRGNNKKKAGHRMAMQHQSRSHQGRRTEAYGEGSTHRA